MNLQNDKLSLIKLIEWYRDKYHKQNVCHNEIIQKIKDANSPNELEIYEKIVDSWFDY